MARFDMSGLDDVINQMRSMGQDAGSVAEAMVRAGSKAVAEAWRQSAEEHHLRDTGAMIESIGPGKIHRGGLIYADIYPQGTDEKGVRNAAKAFYLHYGTSRIAATRWVDDADKYSAERAVPVMREIWERYLETGQVSADAGGLAKGITKQRG